MYLFHRNGLFRYTVYSLYIKEHHIKQMKQLKLFHLFNVKKVICFTFTCHFLSFLRHSNTFTNVMCYRTDYNINAIFKTLFPIDFAVFAFMQHLAIQGKNQLFDGMMFWLKLSFS